MIYPLKETSIVNVLKGVPLSPETILSSEKHHIGSTAVKQHTSSTCFTKYVIQLWPGLKCSLCIVCLLLLGKFANFVTRLLQ